MWVYDAMATIFSDALAIAAADFRRATEVTYFGAHFGHGGRTGVSQPDCLRTDW